MKKKPLIMIVDDIYDNIEVLLTVLKVRGYDLVYAMSGKEALEKLETCRPDLILLDILMPEMDGFETCDAIKDLPGMDEIPIIFLTGVNDQDYILQGFEYGAVDYITKPFNTLELISRVKNHIDLKISKDKLVEYQAELQKHIADKNKFFSVIADDLRSNFKTFMGIVDVLASGYDRMSEEDRKLMFSDVSNSGTMLSGALNSLFLWSRLQTDSIQINREKTNIKDLVGDSVFKLGQYCHENNITIKNTLPEGVVALVDYDKMMTVLDNVLDNAVIYSGSGAEIIISGGIREADKILELQIADNGPGMKPDFLENIFKLDRELPENKKDDSHGLGLGLIVSKELTEKNGGTFALRSVPEAGTTVIITLPTE